MNIDFEAIRALAEQLRQHTDEHKSKYMLSLTMNLGMYTNEPLVRAHITWDLFAEMVDCGQDMSNLQYDTNEGTLHLYVDYKGCTLTCYLFKRDVVELLESYQETHIEFDDTKWDRNDTIKSLFKKWQQLVGWGLQFMEEQE